MTDTERFEAFEEMLDERFRRDRELGLDPRKPWEPTEENLRTLWRDERWRNAVLDYFARYGDDIRMMPPQALGPVLRPDQPIPSKPVTPIHWAIRSIWGGQEEITANGFVMERGRWRS